MRNFIIETLETAKVSYNVLVEDGCNEKDALRKFEDGHFDGRLLHDTTDVEIVKVREGN